MRHVVIDAVEILPNGWLLVKVTPYEQWFENIYRTATGVWWDDSRQGFVAPKPRDWPYSKWFMQILADARSELGVYLQLSEATLWNNIPDDVRYAIIAINQGM